jgi:predicted ArsR family transcriptional regulator
MKFSGISSGPVTGLMHTTRLAVVDALRGSGQATVNQLATMVGIKAITVRHHLNTLLAEGLIVQEEKRQAVGRPVHIYHLTERAEGFYPQTYHRLADRLLNHLKQTLTPEAANTLIRSLATTMAAEIREQLECLPETDRLRRLTEWLAQEGFMARWQLTSEGAHLVEYRCPYFSISQHHPELCQIDEILIRVALNTELSRQACMLSGDPACQFLLIKRAT